MDGTPSLVGATTFSAMLEDAAKLMRPMLGRVQVLAAIFAAFTLLLLVLWLGGLLGHAEALGMLLPIVGVAVVLVATSLVIARRTDRISIDAGAAALRQRHVFDALDLGVVLFDADRRIVLFNEHFGHVYASLGDAVRAGVTYEQFLRAVVLGGMAPEAAGIEEDWIAQRLSAFGNTGFGLIRQYPDGTWRRIVERRLPDGGVLAYIVDVSDSIAKEHALERARRDAQHAREQLADAIEAMPATFELYDADDRLVLWNRALADAYPHMAPHLGEQLRFEELARMNLASGGQPEYSERHDEWIALRQAQRRGGAGTSPPTLLNNGRGGFFRLYERRLRDGSMIAIRVDVTEFELQRRALAQVREALERSRQQLEDAIEALPAGFELYDAEDRLLMVNQMNLEMYPQLAGLAERHPTFEEVVRINAARGGLPLLQSPGALDAWIMQRVCERKQPQNVRVHQIADDRWVRVHERRTRDGGLVAIRLDISELMQRERELVVMSKRLELANQDLSALSRTDSLTGLANRRAFDLRLAEEVSHAIEHNAPLALLLIDIDHFKRYNDRYGHPAGDDCLRRVAAVLRDQASRPTDLVVRLGGEEFAMLLPFQTAEAALPFAQNCVLGIGAAAIEHADSPIAAVVTVSIGVADLSGCSEQKAAALLAAADAAMYLAKQNGRNQAMSARPPYAPR
jgi:diguanylate cyclase (GGDEF)-like protein